MLTVLVVLLFPFANLTAVCLIPIEIGEDEVEDVSVPADRLAFDAFLDILPHVSKSGFNDGVGV
jgi:hypothetical protein